MNLELGSMPSTFDLLHLILALLSLVLLIMVVTQRKSSTALPASQEVPATAAPTEPVTAETPEVKPEPKPAILKEATPDAALQLLTLLQQDARFIDFVNEDLSSYSDEDIGAAARVVHEGSKKTLDAYFTLQAIRTEDEESRISLPEGFNASEVRLTGNVVGEAPFSGTLIHKGWKASEVKLPKLAEGHDVAIIAPAEVEL